jgi:hypothetical protein
LQEKQTPIEDFTQMTESVQTNYHPLTEEELGQIEQLAARASKFYLACPQNLGIAQEEGKCGYHPMRPEDAAFCGAARQHVPRLTAEVRRLWARVAELDDLIDCLEDDKVDLEVQLEDARDEIEDLEDQLAGNDESV